MRSQHHFYGNVPISGSPQSYLTERNFVLKYGNFIQTGSDTPCAEYACARQTYARTLRVREEPGQKGAPPSETALTERPQPRGWLARRAPLLRSQACRGVGHRPPLPGSRRQHRPRRNSMAGAERARSATRAHTGGPGYPVGRQAGWRPEQARRGARKVRHGAEGSAWRRVEAEGLPEGLAAEGCWVKEGSPRTLPFLELSLLPAGGSPGSVAPAKAGNRAMSQLTTTTVFPNCPAEWRGKMAPRRWAHWEMKFVRPTFQNGGGARWLLREERRSAGAAAGVPLSRGLRVSCAFRRRRH